MKQNEKELFKRLCSFKENEFDTKLLNAATPSVLGHIFFNRMQAIAYGTLKKHSLLSKINREFRNSLKSAYYQNIQKNKSFLRCVKYVGDILSLCDCKYAMLKGAYLCKVYPDGYRTSNDIDLLVKPKDVTQISKVLSGAGFKQGNICNDEFIPATRREIIESKMMRGETVPYIKEVNLPQMKFLEVDINFSLDYKPEDSELLENMIEKSVITGMGDHRIRTLNPNDFFVHLCSHLYKEATTLPWVEMKRDMTLYKYCDIYMLINNLNEEHIDSLFKHANSLSMEKVCAFAVLQTAELFEFKNEYAVKVAKMILANDCDFLHIVISPKGNKKYIFCEKDILKRFFCNDRAKLLREVE